MRKWFNKLFRLNEFSRWSLRFIIGTTDEVVDLGLFTGTHDDAIDEAITRQLNWAELNGFEPGYCDIIQDEV